MRRQTFTQRNKVYVGSINLVIYCVFAPNHQAVICIVITRLPECSSLDDQIVHNSNKPLFDEVGIGLVTILCSSAILPQKANTGKSNEYNLYNIYISDFIRAQNFLIYNTQHVKFSMK